jgi:hypothetical protein
MRHLRSFFLRLFGAFSHSEQDINSEIEANLQLHVDDKVRAGMSLDEARRDAILKLGGIARAKEAWRERRSFPLLENLAQDTRFALRQLRKNPGFTATSMLMLATGFCASVAIFAFVDARIVEASTLRKSGPAPGSV